MSWEEVFYLPRPARSIDERALFVHLSKLLPAAVEIEMRHDPLLILEVSVRFPSSAVEPVARALGSTPGRWLDYDWRRCLDPTDDDAYAIVVELLDEYEGDPDDHPHLLRVASCDLDNRAGWPLAFALLGAIADFLGATENPPPTSVHVNDTEESSTSGSDPGEGAPPSPEPLVTAKALIQKMDERTVGALEQAVAMAMDERQQLVMTEHHLLALLDSKPFGTLVGGLAPVDVIRRAAHRALRRATQPLEGKPQFNPRMVDWWQDAWLLGSLEAGHERIGATALIVTLTERPQQYAEPETARALQRHAAVAPRSLLHTS